MKDFFESFFDTIKTRYRNKFIGTFVLAYFGLNWKKIIALLFISDLKYQEFIIIWTDSSATFWMTIFWASLISIVYLTTSPWISYFVHAVQSTAITKYKIQTLKNEMYFISKKQEMELARSKLLEIEKTNAESKAEIKDLQYQNGIDNPDKLIFKKIISILAERKIKEYILDISNTTIGYDFNRSLKQLCSEISTIENKFKSASLQESAKALEKSGLKVLDYIETSRVLYSKNNISKKISDEYVKELNDFLAEYRSFYELGSKL